MADSGGNVQHLDTNKFSVAVEALKKGVVTYNDIRKNVANTTNTLFLQWQGEGKKHFEKDYNTIYRQLNDIGDIMYELRDSLIEAQAGYIQADEEAAKILTFTK